MLETYYQLKRQLNDETAVIDLQGEFALGTVYTPEHLSYDMLYLLIADQSTPDFKAIWHAFIHRSVQLSSTELEHYARDLLDRLWHKRIVDFCCGSGILLMAYAEFTMYLGTFTTVSSREILENLFYNSITGVDINPQAIKAFKLLINTFSNAFGVDIDLTKVQTHVKDALVTHYSQSFDYVIANPPYIGEKNHKELFDHMRQTDLGQQFYEGKMDYFYFFIYKAYDLLKADGRACFLSTNYFFTADGAVKLRAFIKASFPISRIIDYASELVFESKKLHACAYTLDKSPVERVESITGQGYHVSQIAFDSLFDSQNQIHFIVNQEEQLIIDKIIKQSHFRLEDLFEVHQGIVSGADRTSKAEGNQPIFVFKADEVTPFDTLGYFKPFFKNSQIKHFDAESKAHYKLLYLTSQDVIPDEILTHLEPFKERLEKRREVRKNIRKWYEITWPRKEHIFNVPKVIAPQRATSNRFAYVETPFYASADVYYIVSRDRHLTHLNLKVLTFYLNSDLMRFWLFRMGKKKGDLLELYATPLKNVPLPDFSREQCQYFECLAHAYYEAKSLSKSDLTQLINDQIYQYFGLDQEAIAFIEGRKYESHH